jgi:hypothetical protein
LFLFFKKESAFFFEKKKQKTFDYEDLSGYVRMITYQTEAIASWRVS